MSVSSNRFKQLSAHDFELLATLSERIHYTNSNEPFLNHAFVVLNEAVPCTFLSVESFSLNPIAFEQTVNVGVPIELHPSYKKYLHQHPILKYFVTHWRKSDVATILTLTSADKFHKTELYQKFYKPLGVEDQLILHLAHPKGFYVVAYSRDTAFSEKEKTILELLKPQIYIALINWQRSCEFEKFSKTLEEKSSVVEPHNDAKCLIDRLTPKQRAVAEQVARGLKNRQIAKELHISPKTVGKHLENIFETLDIHHRTALAAMWFRSGQQQ
jgi:DNA-binding CsgD family transcriptional regulator